MVKLYHHPPSGARRYLQDPSVEVRGLIDPQGKGLEAFVVFERMQERLHDSRYSAMYEELLRLLPAPNLRAFLFQWMWWNEGRSFEQEVIGIINAFQDDLGREADKVVLFALSFSDPSWALVREQLGQNGFRLSPEQFSVMEWKLPRRSVGPRVLRLGEVHIRSMADAPVDMASLASCYNQVLFGGEERVSPAQMEQLCARPGFSREISMIATAGGSGEIVGLLLASRWGVRAELTFMGFVPTYRRRRLSLRSMPFFLGACVSHGVSTMRFTINLHNEPIRGFVETHLRAREVERCVTQIWVSQGRGHRS